MILKFNQYLENFGKSYGTQEEYDLRKQIFSEIDTKIEIWNSDSTKTHKLIHNKFSDMTESEKKKVNGFLGEKKKLKKRSNSKTFS
jgi:hypothetical protein